MSIDVDAMATEVVLLVKTAIGPVLERQAVLEQANRDLQARVCELAVMRDRLVSVETKAALPLVFPETPPSVDLTPVLERMSAAEARLAVLGDLRDRVVTVETKAAIPAPAPVAIDLAPVLARLDVLEAMPPPEGPMGVPGLDGAPGPAGQAGPQGERGLEGHAGTPGRDGDRGPTGDKGVDGVIGPPGDRGPDGPAGLARDGRDGLPGVPGLPGEKGLDGLHGKDGVDGLGVDNFEELYDGERTWTHRYHFGDRVKEFVWKVPMVIYRGVYVEGKTYERGDGATWAGSEWHANETTTSKPGDGSKSWTLKVKRGRDGKDSTR